PIRSFINQILFTFFGTCSSGFRRNVRGQFGFARFPLANAARNPPVSSLDHPRMKQSSLLARYKNLAAFTALALPALTHSSVLAQTCPDNVPHITGTWTVLPYQMPINPISANLLPNGKVLIVAGSENDASNNSEGAESYRAAVWDPSGTNESSISV